MRRDRHSAIQPAEPMRPVQLHRAPLLIQPIHPVEPPPRIRDPDRQHVLPAGLRRMSQLRLKRQLLHDRVTHKLLVQIHLGPQMRAAHMQKYPLARHRRGNLNLPPPPRHAEVRAIQGHRIVRCIAILIRRVWPRLAILTRAKLPPEVLLHRARQPHLDRPRWLARQHIPAARRRVARQRLTLAAHHAVRILRHILRQVDRVVFPLRLAIHPQKPALVRNQRPVLRPWLRRMRRRCALRPGKLHLCRDSHCRRSSNKRAPAEFDLLHKP